MRKIICLAVASVVLSVSPVLASSMQSIRKDSVNVRSNPNMKSEVVFETLLGYPIQIEKRQNNWVYFTDWKKRAGRVYQPLVSRTQTALIVVEDANIRKGPSLRRPAVKQASKGEIYKIFDEKGEWVKVGYYLENEVIGWIRQDLVWGE
ncbi:MAG TPA: SH3 domain-containing protein [Desulfobaccales bacterium]|nr:SH3 domain-containing protein [Desulfobaccales bacterium]